MQFDLNVFSSFGNVRRLSLSLFLSLSFVEIDLDSRRIEQHLPSKRHCIRFDRLRLNNSLCLAQPMNRHCIEPKKKTNEFECRCCAWRESALIFLFDWKKTKTDTQRESIEVIILQLVCVSLGLWEIPRASLRLGHLYRMKEEMIITRQALTDWFNVLIDVVHVDDSQAD